MQDRTGKIISIKPNERGYWAEYLDKVPPRFLEKNTKIILEAKEAVKWFVNEKFLGKGQNYVFTPQRAGQYQIKAEDADGFQEIVAIYINK